MPYHENGNALQYIRKNPNCVRDKIVSVCCEWTTNDNKMLKYSTQLHHITLGLVYLHSQGVVHGDLKAVRVFSSPRAFFSRRGPPQLNVLIDDGGKSVLCDFGLSRIKADVCRQSDPGTIMGSRNWMAPERFQGERLREA